MENNNKSQAEIYREERKARLAKAAAKNAKKSPKLSMAKKKATKVISIVLVVALILSAFGGILNFFGIPQKTLKVKAGNDIEFTLAEFNYYYYMVWSNYQSTAIQYEQYGTGYSTYMLGYDYTLSPEEQAYTDNFSSITGVTVAELGVDEPTWSDAFKYAAINNLVQIKYCVAEAKKAGITLTAEESAEIDKAIEEMRSTAKSNDYSLDRYIRATYGNGLSEKVIRNIFEENYIANSYTTKLQEDIRAEITDDQIKAEYDKNKDKYDLVDFRLYTFETATPKYPENATEEEKTTLLDAAQAAEKAEAEAFLANVTDADSFITGIVPILAADKAAEEAAKKETSKVEIGTESAEDKENASKPQTEEEKRADTDEATDFSSYTYDAVSQMNDDLLKWLYDDARVNGDKTVIEIQDGVYVAVLLTKAQYQNTAPSSHDVRHILVQFPTDSSGKTVELSVEEKGTYMNKATEILNSYKENPTEDNFSQLAIKNSEDPGSKEDGGLIAGIKDDGTYVQEFTDWSVDPTRKSGDTGIIETSYGYHVMYYVKGNSITWHENAAEVVFQDQYNALFSEVMDSRMANVKIDSFLVNWASNGQNKMISKLIALNYNK